MRALRRGDRISIGGHLALCVALHVSEVKAGSQPGGPEAMRTSVQQLT